MSDTAVFAGMSLEDAVEFLEKARSFDFNDDIVVQWRGSDVWAIVNVRNNEVYSFDDEWIFEPMNTARTLEFKRLTRFSLGEAIKLVPAAKLANSR
jgi:hypothetical protein